MMHAVSTRHPWTNLPICLQQDRCSNRRLKCPFPLATEGKGQDKTIYPPHLVTRAKREQEKKIPEETDDATSNSQATTQARQTSRRTRLFRRAVRPAGPGGRLRSRLLERRRGRAQHGH